MRLRALLLVAVLLLVGGPAHAQSHFRDAIKGAVRGSTFEEVVAWSDAQFAKRATIGRYVRWGGSVLLGAAFVYTALDWFYNELKRETGTPLDTWYHWGDMPPIIWAGTNPDKFANEQDWYQYLRSVTLSTSCWVTPLVRFIPREYSWTQDKVEIYFYYHPSGPLLKVADLFYTSNALEQGRQEGLRMWRSHLNGNEPCSNWNKSRPPLSEWLQSHPDATRALRDQVLVPYVESQPIGSPLAPYPGVRLEPTPNPNQWTDNPFTRPDIDTDGDGYPDSVEWEEANRRGVPWPDLINDPNVYPHPQADPDGDGFTTGEEISLGTDPYDPASSPARRPRPRTDTDGDGWPDEEEMTQGTDFRDPNSKPLGTPPLQDTDGDGVPDAEEIGRGTDPANPEDKPEKEEEWPGGPPPGRIEPVQLPEVPTEEKKEIPSDLIQRVGQQWSEKVTQRVRERLRELQETARQRFPFALVSALRMDIQQGSASCSWSVPIGPFTGQLNICDTPFWQTAASFRPVLAGLLWLTVALAIIRRGLDVQA